MGVAQLVLYIKESSLADFLKGKSVVAYPHDRFAKNMIGVLADHSCIELGDDCVLRVREDCVLRVRKESIFRAPC